MEASHFFSLFPNLPDHEALCPAARLRRAQPLASLPHLLLRHAIMPHHHRIHAHRRCLLDLAPPPCVVRAGITSVARPHLSTSSKRRANAAAALGRCPRRRQERRRKVNRKGVPSPHFLAGEASDFVLISLFSGAVASLTGESFFRFS